ncbi:SDR family oxidoreductase [Peribacillus sp. SCS-155]|uniref:SDR family oxidoreductase n=1 Tax=Peribacillus sedimenti TaxID=3115297 RepID=UPI0039063840
MNINQLFDLSGKTAIVTGGGRGLGKQMAIALAEAGANIVVCSRNLKACMEVSRQLKGMGVDSFACPCDVSKKADIEDVIDQTLETFGKIDILINNSGTAFLAPLLKITEQQWKDVMDVNVLGAFLFSQAAARVMIKQGYGKIINIASIAGYGGSSPAVMQAVPYNTSKGAVITLTKDLSIKLARYGIQVNAIAPGFFPTEMSNDVLKPHLKIESHIPIGRYGNDTDLKGVTVLLASHASDYMTGQILNVDGGITASV